MKESIEIFEKNRKVILTEFEERFERQIISPIGSKVTQYLKNILEFREGFELIKDKEKLKAIVIYYNPSGPLSYLLTHPFNVFHDNNIEYFEPYIIMDDYDYSTIESIISDILKNYGIMFNWEEHSDSIYPAFIAIQEDLETKFVANAWQKAKLETSSEIKAFYIAGDNGSDILDLDNNITFENSVSSFLNYMSKYGR